MLFFILLATAFAHNLKSVSMVEKIFLDPVAFAQSFENASPSAVNAVIDMVQDLIAEGNGKKAGIIKDHEDAVVASAAALDALNVALDILETATGERIEADDEVTRLGTVLQQKQSAEHDAVVNKNSATTALNNAQAWMDSEVTRVDAEKASLEEVLQILADLPEGFRRRLLSSSGSLMPVGMIAAMSSTDPAAVKEVVDLVQALIDAGEGVRASVTGDRDDAAAELDDRTGAWKHAVSETVAAQDALAAGEGVASQLLGVEQAKRAIHDDKTAIHNAAVTDEEEKEAIRTEQVPILDHENEQLHNVVEILEGLLPQA